MTPRRSVVGAVALLLALLCPQLAIAKFQPPPLKGHFVDTSGTIRWPDTDNLERKLTSMSGFTDHQVVVFVMKSLEGESIEDVAYTTFNTWKIGEAGKDNGLLLVIAVAEHKIRIETGKGAGGAITDLQSNDIIQHMAPLMATGRTLEAIQLAITELKAALLKDLPQSLASKPAPPKRQRSMVALYVVLGFFAVFGVLCIVSAEVRRKAWPALGLLWQLLSLILKILGAIVGRKSSGSGPKSASGGGQSGGGGSSGSF